jgi:DNA repair exonuclease SbcCD ATPase subunit
MNGLKHRERVKDLRETLNKIKGKKEYLLKEMRTIADTIKTCTKQKMDIEEAQLIIQEVAKQTQQELEYHISEVVSTALSSVFDDPYEFKVEFVIKRGKTEADLYFIRRKERVDPLSASGGGVVDVASFALRIALWNLLKGQISNTIWLDEPFKMLSRELQPKAGEMIKMLSDKLKIQFIIITHNQDIIESADKVFEIKQNSKGVSEAV